MRIFLYILIVTLSACNFTQKIKDGEMAYDRKQFSVAVHMLTDEFDRTDYPDIKARKAFLIAESYSEINDVPNAIEWYKKAFDLDYGDKALERLAFALKKNEQYREAVNVFKAVQKRIGQNPKIAREISECSMAVDWIAEKERSPYEINRLSQNSAYSDYAPVLFESGQLVFTSDRKSDENQDIYNWTGNWFSDIYLVNQFSKDVVPFDGKINSPYNDGTPTFNSDFSEVFFTRCKSELDDDYCKLMHSKRTDGGWTEPMYLDFIEDRINYAHPTLHENDSIMFFVAEIEEGFGGYDIYYTERQEEGWAAPEILGSRINTPGNEKFPFLDGDTLYFASDGRPGMGGLDIFKAYVKEDGSWSKTENMKPPINSGADDFGLIIDVNKRRNTGELTGYFTTSRKGTESDDIFSFRSRIIADPVIEEEVVEEETEEAKLYLAIKTFENKYLIQEDPLSGVTGKLPLSDVELIIESPAGQQKISSGNKGFQVIDISPDQTYTIKAAKNEYLSEIASFTASDVPKRGEKTYNISLLLEKIFTDREIVLENIYYDFNEYFIRDDAKPSLNSLSELLNNNPTVKIQLFSHTDCRGKDELNMTLSQNRAQAAVDYLISVGIAPERMQATGLGESKPAINCYCETCSEEEHQENRRTSFKIIEY